MRNRFPGPCYRCRTTVEVGDGHFELRHPRQVVGKFRLQHWDCAIFYRGLITSSEGVPRPTHGMTYGDRVWMGRAA